MKASPNAYMVLDLDHRFVYVNPAYEAATGRRLDDVVGQKMFDVFPAEPGTPAAAMQPVIVASMKRAVASHRRDVIPYLDYSIEVETPDGPVLEERYWSVTHSPVLGDGGEVVAILQSAEDVTELHRLRLDAEAVAPGDEAPGSDERAARRARVGATVLRRASEVQAANVLLANEQRRLRQMFDQAPGFMALLTGPDHVLTMVNRAYLDIVGRDERIVGQTVREALPEVSAQNFLDLLDRVYTSGEPFVGRALPVQIARRADAPLEQRYVDFVYQPLSGPDGATVGIFVQGSDVTEQVEAQQHLAQLNATLEERVAQRTAQIEVRNRELQEFAYVASHDLQEPLRKIRTFADLLEQDTEGLGDDARMYVGRMRSAAGRMSRLIGDLLTYSRMATRSTPATALDLGAVLAEVVSDLQPSFDTGGARLDAGPLPAVVADPTQMHQLLLNLVGNAVKFARPDAPPVVTVRGRIEPSGPGEPPGGTVVLTVADNGIGIDPRHAERIFQPFQRLHTRAEYEGTGIGLAIARRVVDRRGGTISVESTPGEGSTFTVRLPVTPPVSPDDPPAAPDGLPL